MAKKQTENYRSSEQKLTKKERKALKKQQEAEQRELEKTLIEEGKIAPRVKYERRSFLWKQRRRFPGRWTESLAGHAKRR